MRGNVASRALPEAKHLSSLGGCEVSSRCLPRISLARQWRGQKRKSEGFPLKGGTPLSINQVLLIWDQCITHGALDYCKPVDKGQQGTQS